MTATGEPAAGVDWGMRAGPGLLDWGTASGMGKRLCGAGPPLSRLDRARLDDDFAELVPRAESLVREFTGLHHDGYRARAWVMSRGEWIDANLRGFQRGLEPLVKRAFVQHGIRSGGLRRKVLGAQIGALMGYVSRKVLGQYDLFLPPDDDGTLYFVGPNVVGIERRFRFQPREFRLWLCLHEVAHRVQFGSVPWLRTHLEGQIDRYLAKVDLDPKRLMAALRRAVEDIRKKGARGADLIPMLMTPEQRGIFERMQAMMSLLEGHGNFVMDRLGATYVQQAERMRRGMQARRRSSRMERSFQRLIGFDRKINQYATGERFVAHVVDRAGMEGFNRVWEGEGNLPSLAEVMQPEEWLARVAPT